VFLTCAVIIVTGLFCAGWCGAILLNSRDHPRPVAPARHEATPTPIPSLAVATQPVLAPALTDLAAAETPDSRSTLHEELPDVPDKALATIHGRMLFAVHVTADPSAIREPPAHRQLSHPGASCYRHLDLNSETLVLFGVGPLRLPFGTLSQRCARVS
jgi:hypothetical protein